MSLGVEWGGDLAARLASVNVGLPRDIAWRGKTVQTGIWKNSVQGRVMVRRLNIDGDGQGDLVGHGGAAWQLHAEVWGRLRKSQRV